MCGIVGVIGDIQKDQRESYVNRMNQAIIHRGPDGKGWYSDNNCTLAMSRLSVIDLKTGEQPKYNASKTALIFFNGEIYNHHKLKKSLLRKGYKFITNSDTEVLIHLYDEYGQGMLEYLRGMFVFCIYDKSDNDYFFARDRFGEKPLYYFCYSNYLIFSSEIKSLLECPIVPRMLNREMLHYYLTASYVPDPFTLLKDVYSLPAGYYMKYANSEIITKSYFKVNSSVDPAIKTVHDAVDYVKPAFFEAVKSQMVSDVPLGAFLSGGIDSSSVVASMQYFSESPINTFNVKFEESTYDESPIAREVAHKLGTNHHEIVIPNAEFTEEIFWKIIDHVGLPFPDSSAIPTYYISKAIKKEVTVALSGDGGDELFGGYPIFDWYNNVLRLQQYPLAIRDASKNLLTILSKFPILKGSSSIRQLKKAINLSYKKTEEIPGMLHSMFDEDEIKKIQVDFMSDYKHLKEFPVEFNEWERLRQMMYYRLKYNLPLDMLTKVDRMSMASSLEVRAPFLDYDLFLKSSKIPSKYLRKGGVGKIVIREMMKNDVPESVFTHPKSGFSIPLHKYQNKAFRNLVDKLFFDEQTLSGLVSDDYLLKIRNLGIGTQKSNASMSVYQASHQLWSLLQLAGWIKRFNIDISV